MKEFINHPEYGVIVYEESFWTGKKSLTVNGVATYPVSKREFMIGGKRAVIKGSVLTGATLSIEGETIELSKRPTWYEILLSGLPFIFLMVWGNSEDLCAIFPVVGGALGGGLGGAGIVTALLLMKKTKSPLYKVLIGLGILVATVLIAFLLAIAILLLLA